MHRTISTTVVAVACCLSLALASTAATAAPTGRVVNGTPVSPATWDARWRSIAVLTLRGEADTRKGHFCAGTFISTQLVVTAAHCVSDPSQLLLLDEGWRYVRYNNARPVAPTTFHVVGGRRTLSVRDGDRVAVANILIHPRFDPVSGTHDVAIVQLARPVRDTAGVVPVGVVEPGEDGIWGGGSGTSADPSRGPWIAGWGLRLLPEDEFFFSGSQHTPTLRPTRPTKRPTYGTKGRAGRSLANGLEEALVPVHSDARCEVGTSGGPDVGYGRDFDPETMFCAGVLDSTDANDENATTNGVDACFGDSGGPMLASTGSALRLVGVISFGNGCAARDSFGVYSRVAAMRSFLGSIPRRPVQVATRPRVSGAPFVGSTLTCSPGRWMGAGRERFSYRWVRPMASTEEATFAAAEAWERIPGSVARRTYRVRASDRGQRIACLVIATNGATTAAENSHPQRVPGTAPVPVETEQPEGDDDDDEGFFTRR